MVQYIISIYKIKEIKMKNVLDTIINWATTSGLRLVVALVVMFISFKLINFFSKKIISATEKKHLDKTISKTLAYIFKIGAKCLIAVCLIGFVGIDTSGITALIASLGVCVGLAVNGALANLAGGVLIIVTRPFRVDDFIEAQGYSGTVEDIRITNTKIITPDNKVVYLPNGALSSGNIVNYSEKDIRRVDHTFSISYSDDFSKAKSIISEICENHELVLKDPAITVRVCAHNASSIDIVTRVWVESENYWTVHFDLLEAVKTEFDKQGIEIPFNQLDVHVKQ